MSNEGETTTHDLDVFLAGVESKLRAPFSSLELSRAISTAPCSKEYLETIGKVLSRMDKTVQLRLLVGLLGVEPTKDTDTAIYELLTQAQDKTLFDDWAVVAAGLVQGILFYNDSGERDVGNEATEVMAKVCGGIDVRKLLQQEAEQQGKEFKEETRLKGIIDQISQAASTSSEVVDLNPLFAPYYYSLVNPETLERILPECMSNPHFTVNEDADILKEDERREREEQTAVASATASRVSEEAAPAALPPVIMPGRQSTAAKPKARTPAAKSSMFLPSRKPGATAGGRMGRQMQKPGLHTRKAGAAQKLLGKSRQLGQKSSARGGASGATGSTAGGRAMKFGNARSKMKMIDVSEVSELNKERQERETKETREQKMSAKKRKIMEAAAARGLVGAKGAKRSKPNGEAAGSAQQGARPNGPGRLEQAAAAALLSYQQQNGGQAAGTAASLPQMPLIAPAPDNRMALVPPGNEEELALLLEKSNKLSEENRLRVRQFWIDRYNVSIVNI